MRPTSAARRSCSIAGGEPLMHPEMRAIVRGLIASAGDSSISARTRCCCRERIDEFQPDVHLSLSIHLDGPRAEHDLSVCRQGVYDTRSPRSARRCSRGFRVTTNTTLFEGADPERMRQFFDEMMELGVEGMMISPGYSYEKAPDQEHFLRRERSHQLFARMLESPKRSWRFNQSPLFLQFLMGKRDLECTPWGNPTYNMFGWQRPCYLLQDGYAQTFRELMEETDWAPTGTRRNPRCQDCMVHCGFEPTAVDATFRFAEATGLDGGASMVTGGCERTRPSSIERAFEYRGYVTIRARDGSRGRLRLRPRAVRTSRCSTRVRHSGSGSTFREIADIAFTGEDRGQGAAVWEPQATTSSQVGWATGGRPALFVGRAADRAAWHRARARRQGPRRIPCSAGSATSGDRGRSARRRGGVTSIAAEKPRLVISCGFRGRSSTLAPGGRRCSRRRCATRAASLWPRGNPCCGSRGRRSADHGRVAEGEIVCATEVVATARRSARSRGRSARGRSRELGAARAARAGGDPVAGAARRPRSARRRSAGVRAQSRTTATRARAAPRAQRPARRRSSSSGSAARRHRDPRAPAGACASSHPSSRTRRRDAREGARHRRERVHRRRGRAHAAGQGARRCASCSVPAPRRTSADAAAVEVVHGDLRDAESRARAPPRDAAAIFHAGGAVFVHRRPAASCTRPTSGARATCSTAARAVGARLVYTSSISTIGGMRGGVIPDEHQDASARAPGPYKESKWQAEQLVREEAKRGARCGDRAIRRFRSAGATSSRRRPAR